jgi:hypothetical protein
LVSASRVGQQEKNVASDFHAEWLRNASNKNKNINDYTLRNEEGEGIDR